MHPLELCRIIGERGVTAMKLKYPLFLALSLLIIGSTTSCGAGETKMEPKVHSNELGLVKSTFLVHQLGTVGDMEIVGSKFVIAGSTQASFSSLSNPSQQTVQFAVPEKKNRILPHKIAVIVGNGVRFYNHDVVRDETGKILGYMGFVSGFEEVCQVDVNGDAVVDFFVAKDANPYLFKGTFKKAVDVNGRAMEPVEYKKYYPIFLYDKVVAYPLGSGTKYYQKAEAKWDSLKLRLYALKTKKAVHEFAAGKRRGPEGYEDIALIDLGGNPYVAVLLSIFYQGDQIVGFRDIDSALIIYDREGKAVYQEIFEDYCGALLATVLEGKQTLLLGCDNIIYNYTGK